MTTTVSLIKKKFKRMKWSLFLKRGVLRVTRTKALENFTRRCAYSMMKSLSFFLSFFLSLSRLDAQFFSFFLLDDFSVFFVRWFRAPFFEQVV